MIQPAFDAISKAITEGDDIEAERLVRQALVDGLPPSKYYRTAWFRAIVLTSHLIHKE